MQFESLHINILIYIFSFLDYKTLCKLLFLNKKIYRACFHKSLGLRKYRKLGVGKILFKYITREVINYKDITTLNLIEVALPTFPNIDKLPNLNVLSVYYTHLNYILNIKSDTVKDIIFDDVEFHKNEKFTLLFNFSKLETLYLTECSLYTMPVMPLNRLVSVILNTNYIEEIPVLESSTLKYLYMSNNMIKTFPDISKLTNISVLHLDSNDIKNLPIIYSDTLTKLNLNFNSIQKLPDIKYMKKLENLKLQKNKIESVYDLYSTSLTNLELFDNNIKIFPDITNLNSIKSIHISNNLISELKNISSNTLEILFIDTNKIKYMKNINLPNLSKLEISYNKLKYFSFENMYNLKKAYIGFNKINEIDSSSITKLNKIKRISTIKNKLNERHFIGVRPECEVKFN